MFATSLDRALDELLLGPGEVAAVRAALDDDLDAPAAREAIDVLAGAIIAHAGDDPTAPSGLRQAAGLLGIQLDEEPPGGSPSGT